MTASGYWRASASKESIRSNSRSRLCAISSRSHRRVSSDTCSFRLRPVWILSASAPTFSFSLRMTKVWTSSSVGAFEVVGVGGFGAHFLERRHDALALAGRENAHALQRAGKRLRAPDVHIEKSRVEVQRAGKALKHLGRPGGESSAPKFHGQVIFHAGCRKEQSFGWGSGACPNPTVREGSRSHCRRGGYFFSAART